MLTLNTVSELLTTVRNEPARMALAEVRQNTSMEKAHLKPKLFQLKARADFGPKTLHKLLCFILKTFQDSLKITNPKNEMSTSEIFSAAGMLMEKYTHESIHDFLMALKLYEESGKEVYNHFSKKVLLSIMNAYLNTKSDWLEQLWDADNFGNSGEDLGRYLSDGQLKADYDALKRGEPTEAMMLRQQTEDIGKMKALKEHDFQLFKMKYYLQRQKAQETTYTETNDESN
ncbi:hypothetical protein [Larkinella soli]|uniref:hypothetical protein n=1 Tax=Larkinella soli TaxID=1770527 RepID=UPI000FFBA6FF|nr:hypothetical protein [Larkinella soli]